MRTVPRPLESYDGSGTGSGMVRLVQCRNAVAVTVGGRRDKSAVGDVEDRLKGIGALFSFP